MGSNRFLLAALLALFATAPAAAQKVVSVNVPKAGWVTLVLTDTAGRIVDQVMTAQYVPTSGPLSVTLDLYGAGTVYYPVTGTNPANQDTVRTDGSYTWQDTLLAPGTYVLRGVVRERLVSVYNADATTTNRVPWPSVSGTGGNLADHNPPQGMACFGAPNPWSATEAGCLVTSATAEAGTNYGFFAFDAGTGQLEKRWEGPNTFSAPAALAIDSIDGAPTITAYGAFYFKQGSSTNSPKAIDLFRIGDDKEIERTVTGIKIGSANAYGGAERAKVGLAVNNQRWVVALNDSTFCFNSARAIVDTVAVSLTGIAWNGGTLYATNEAGELAAYPSFNHASCSLGAKTVLASGLDEPADLALIADSLYVSEWGASNHVSVFLRNGTPVRVYGKTGALQVGTYDPLQMHQPAQVSFVGGKLCVAEAEYTPKRFTCWEATDDAVVLALSDWWYVQGSYSPGGVMLSENAFVYCSQSGDCTEWDYDKGDTLADGSRSNRHPRAVLYRAAVDYADYFEPYVDRYVTIGADTFMVSCGTASEGCGTNAVWFYKDGHRLRPRGAIGRDWDAPSNTGAYADADANLSCLGDNTVFLWQDTDGDGAIDWTAGDNDTNLSPATDEIGCALLGDVNGRSWYTSPYDGASANSSGAYVDPPTVGASKQPVWPAPVKAWTAPTNYAFDPLNSSGIANFRANSGTYLATSQGDVMIGPGATMAQRILCALRGPFRCFVNGVELLRFDVSGPNGDAPTLPPPNQGRVVEPQKAFGPFRVESGARDEFLWGADTDKGAVCLWTIDALGLGCLRFDQRVAFAVNSDEPPDEWFEVTEKGEHWYGQVFVHGDSIYYCGGKEYSGCHVMANPGIVRLDSTTITITSGEIAAARLAAGAVDSFLVNWQYFARDTCTAIITNVRPRVDGQDERPAYTRCTISDVRGTYGSLALTSDSAYYFVGIDTETYNLTWPGRSAWEEAFLDGGFLDLVLWDELGSSARFLMSDAESPTPGQEMGLRIVEDSDGRLGSPSAFVYESPVATVAVEDASLLPSRTACTAAGCEGVFALSDLHFTIAAGDTLRGDYGYIVSDSVEAAFRDYANSYDIMVSDAPEESTPTDSLNGYLAFVADDLEQSASWFSAHTSGGAAGSVSYEAGAVDTVRFSVTAAGGLYAGYAASVVSAQYTATGTDTLASYVEPITGCSALAPAGLYVGQAGHGREAFASIQRSRRSVFAVTRAPNALALITTSVSVASSVRARLRAIADPDADTVALQYDAGAGWQTLATESLTLTAPYVMALTASSSSPCTIDFTDVDVP
jgi:hypothetical protein